MSDKHFESVFQLRDVTKVFITEEYETYALDSVSLDVAEGEFLVVRGPSGCGKSTLLSILGLLDLPTSGSYSAFGVDIVKMTFNSRASLRNRKLGFVFQSFNLIDSLTVLENVALPLKYRKHTTAAERGDKAAELLNSVGLNNRRNFYPPQLSGGQQQRVAIARALVGDPRVLLADEPTGNLDPDSGDQIIELILSGKKSGMTTCMVTHDPRYEDYADRVLLLEDGHIV